jgi:primosomal protein N' (replication factor Y)
MTESLFPTSQVPQVDRSRMGLFTAVVPPLEAEFLYQYELGEHPNLRVGDVVQVSLGRRTTNAFVVSVNSSKETESLAEMSRRSIAVKRVGGDALTAHAFNEEQLSFFSWVSKYYAEPLSRILDMAVPTPAYGRQISLFIVSPAFDLSRQKLSPGQRKAIDFLLGTRRPCPASEIKAGCGASSAIVSALVKRGILQKASESEISHVSTSVESFQRSSTLNPEQLTAVHAIEDSVSNSLFSTFLLHGVTGSGKTEVYLELIIRALQQGRSALVIVPEIALTPQLTDRFIERLKQPVAVLHSSLKASERWKHWENLATNKVRIAIGARSAIFAPLNDLGVIIVDEEHDSSFKQGEGIRYHARDLALVRAKLSRCPVVLGSATPSLETYQHGTSGKYTYLKLAQQYHAAPRPKFEIIDLNGVKPWEMASKSVSPRLLKSLTHALDRGEQAFILFNRRGFASYLQCSSCEYVIGCPHCSVTLTYHQNGNSLLCHQCNFSMVPPIVCHGCGRTASTMKDEEPLFALRGSGTERVFEELASLLPKARIGKLDRDTASTIADYVEILQKVRQKELDILVGTQMIAKGHDLPDVTFVGIVDCDVGLHMPDFRAAEKGFQLLTQVAGRAGRREKQGHIVLQTRVPTHPSVVRTTQSDFIGFADSELTIRRDMGYPPFQKLLRIVISADDRSTALSHAVTIAQLATQYGEKHQVAILGPAPAPIEKVRGLWRYHILAKSPSGPILQNVMRQVKRDSSGNKAVRVAYDLDPQDML